MAGTYIEIIQKLIEQGMDAGLAREMVHMFSEENVDPSTTYDACQQFIDPV